MSSFWNPCCSYDNVKFIFTCVCYIVDKCDELQFLLHNVCEKMTQLQLEIPYQFVTRWMQTAFPCQLVLIQRRITLYLKVI